MRAALGLGCNVGNRRMHLLWAWRQLENHVKVEAFSKMVETAPVGRPAGERAFLNAAAIISGDVTPRGLLEIATELETDLGRNPADREGPRVLDIDILLVDDLELDEPGLVVPHPELTERLFVLDPLADIAGDWLVPGKFCSVEVLLEDLRARR